MHVPWKRIAKTSDVPNFINLARGIRVRNVCTTYYYNGCIILSI